MPNIYHAHFYFSQSSVETARRIYAKAKSLPNTELGSFHERSVGPHIDWSFMILFYHENHSEVTSWLKNNHSDLSVLIHPETGNDLLDHTENAIWLGSEVSLDLSRF
jgi:aromatic ring-cleaving dioxygenase